MAFNYKTKPYEHQKEALLRSFARDNYAYFMEMGCGKSKVLIDNITLAVYMVMVLETELLP